MQTNSHSVKETLGLGKLIARQLEAGDIICLQGELGVGKTALAKGIACGLGINSREVSSPSFILIRQHLEGRLPLYHFDFYRLKGAGEIPILGYEEYLFGEGVSVIEWAERLDYLMPKECLVVELSYAGANKRKMKFSAVGARYKELLSKLKQESRTF